LGEPAYPSIESKAAHLLYFVIKNHPFTDGNRRIGSFLFVEFLHRNGQLTREGAPIIDDVGLAALALLVVSVVLISRSQSVVAGARFGAIPDPSTVGTSLGL
jgi:prophage maintenance system killer protein